MPSVAADDPSFQRGDWGPYRQRRYWRGPVWVNAVWLVWRGLVRLGYQEHATELATRLTRTVSEAGLREYYDPFDGDGMGQRDFAWSTLVLELLQHDDGTR
jgi:glycogen debranching enzyme